MFFLQKMKLSDWTNCLSNLLQYAFTRKQQPTRPSDAVCVMDFDLLVVASSFSPASAHKKVNTRWLGIIPPGTDVTLSSHNFVAVYYGVGNIALMTRELPTSDKQQPAVQCEDSGDIKHIVNLWWRGQQHICGGSVVPRTGHFQPQKGRGGGGGGGGWHCGTLTLFKRVTRKIWCPVQEYLF